MTDNFDNKRRSHRDRPSTREDYRSQVEQPKKLRIWYGDPNKLDFIYSELAFGQLFFVAYSSCLFLADTFTQK
ncbi:hypothetical protein ODY46_07550, partial [Aerococcus sp. CDC-944-U94]|nr:hypothetical protein [Aerococcus sp. Group 1]MCY3057314.1 hypothetical protein [Aerococcus sp. Group 1]